MFKLVSAEVYLRNITLKKPFEVTFWKIEKRPLIFIKLTDSLWNTWRWECAHLQYPIFTHEDHQTCIHVLKNLIFPNLLNKEMYDPLQDTWILLDWIKGHQITKYWLEMALVDLLAFRGWKQVCEFIGWWALTRAEYSITIPFWSDDELLDSTASAISRWIKLIKLKAKDRGIVWRLELFRESYPDVMVWLDFNAALYAFDSDAKYIMDAVQALWVDTVEQPFVYGNITDTILLNKEYKFDVAYDEWVCGIPEFSSALSLWAISRLNIKPWRVWWVRSVLELNSIASKNRIGCWCGWMLETPLWVNFLLHMNTLSSFVHPLDCMDYLEFYETNVLEIVTKIEVNSWLVLWNPSWLLVNEDFIRSVSTRVY